MLSVFYTETNSELVNHYWRTKIVDTWEKIDLYDGSDSVAYQYDDGSLVETHAWHIPASAVVEIACRNIRPDQGFYQAGVRSIGSSKNRILNLHEAEGGGHTNVSMFVQADADSCIEVRSSNNNSTYGPRYSIVGYWRGVEYIDLIDTFTIGVEETWTNIALSGYGVASGSIVEIACINTSGGYLTSQTGSANIVGARQVGSSIDRKIQLHEPEVDLEPKTPDAREFITMQVQTSGENATIQVYAQHSGIAQFMVLGYWSVAPGDYTECWIDIPPAVLDSTWEARDMGASGLSTGATVETQLVNSFSSWNAIMGVQQNDGTLSDRLLNLHEAESSGNHLARMHTPLQTDGNMYVYHDETSRSHGFIAVGYWDNYIEYPFSVSTSTNCDLFIGGRNPSMHYMETFTETKFPSTPINQWNTKNISSELPSYALIDGAIAEIMIRNRSHSTPVIGGVRSTDSNLERKYEIHESEENYTSIETIMMHVPVSSSGTIETYGGHADYLEFKVVGCWIGGRYIETTGNFDAGATSGWTQHNLGLYGVPEGKIAEILISNSGQTLAHSGGIRAVGSSLDRLVDIASLIDNYGVTWEGSTYLTMFVETSGVGATIEVYAGDNTEIDFNVVGYWDAPPGSYTELAQVLIPDANTSQWVNLDIYASGGIPSGAVAEMILANSDWTNDNILGVRELESTLERRDQWAETNEDGGSYLGLCGGRMHVNTVSGYIQTYHQQANAKSYFATIGYWDNFNEIFTPINDNCPLYVSGSAASINNSCPLYMYGISIADSSDLFITGYDDINAYGDLYVFGAYLCKTNSEYSVNYPSGVSCYTYGSGIIPESGQIDTFIHGHLSPSASGELVIEGSVAISGTIDFYIQAGAFNDISLYILPKNNKNNSCDLFIDSHAFISGTCPLVMGPGISRDSWTFYLKTEDNDVNDTVNLFTFGSPSGVDQMYHRAPLFLQASGATSPYTTGGTNKWTMFLKSQSGNPVSNDSWSMFLKADFTISSTCNLYTYGHASGTPPHGTKINNSIGLICSADPDDLTRIGYIPLSSDPWTLFLRCQAGYFATSTLFISGAAPISSLASGNLFIEGLFGQPSSTATLYMMGILGIIDNGPGGLHLFLDAINQVYNTSGNLYTHGY